MTLCIGLESCETKMSEWLPNSARDHDFTHKHTRGIPTRVTWILGKDRVILPRHSDILAAMIRVVVRPTIRLDFLG